MRIPGLKTLKLGARWLRSRFLNGAIILGHHSVSENPSDPYSLAITPQHFAEQLDVLRKHSHPLSLQELLRALRNGHVPRRAVALTFDDGYADTLYTAKPLLERYDIPATVFITTGGLGHEFWWDELSMLLLGSETLPESVSLMIDGTAHEWTLSSDAGHRLNRDAPLTRLSLLQQLYQQLRPLSHEKRQQALTQLRSWTGAMPQDRPAHRALSPAEVLSLSEGDVIDVGAHTVTHPILATLSPAMQRWEVRQSKAYLEELLDQPVTSFSYPHGSLSTTTADIVREAGFVCACTSFTDVAWSGSDCFQLPRFWVRNWDGERFSRWLSRWLST